MPAPGTLQGDSLANFNEFFSIMEPYVEAVAKNKAKKISNQWKEGLQGIIDAYLGKAPETFTYEGKTYTWHVKTDDSYYQKGDDWYYTYQ